MLFRQTHLMWHAAGFAACAMALGAAVGISGCAHHGCDPGSTGFSDYGSLTGGTATPSAGLRQFLDSHPARVPQSGWRQSAVSTTRSTFTSGGASVTFLRGSDGTWLREEYTMCAP